MFKQELLLLAYNKDVVCVIDQNEFPVCTPKPSPSRRTNSMVPSHDPYIPRTHAIFYNCSSLSCEPMKLHSLTQVTSPFLNLKSCFLHTPEKFDCEYLRYNHFKNVDKLLFLRSNIANKTFYAVDCLIYADTGRVCHRKRDGKETLQPGLVDIGTLVRPNEVNVLSQDEFICEETVDKQVNCDLDPYVPFEDGLKVKPTVKAEADILLKTGTYAVLLKKKCIDNWCGFSGSAKPAQRRRRFWPLSAAGGRRALSGRRWFDRYDPPGGKIFRCYYAKRQQVCKQLYDTHRLVYNERSFIVP